MKDTLKIQVILMGHLRGSSHLSYLKKFFDTIDINILNKKLNANYTNLIIDYCLYTYPEINFKPKILEYGKKNYPELYKEYTIEDFYIWLEDYKKVFNFKTININKDNLIKIDTDTLFKQNVDDMCQDITIKSLSEHIKYHIGYQMNKYEKMCEMIDDDADIIFRLRPDLIFSYDFEKEQSFLSEHINQSIVNILKDTSKSVYINWHVINEGYIWAGDYYHIGNPNNIKLLFKDILNKTFQLIGEYDKLNKNEFPTIYKYIKRFVESCAFEIKQTTNCSIENVNLKICPFRHYLLYVYVPFEKNYNGEIDYHTIHDQ